MPPRPLIATISPRVSRATVAARGSGSGRRAPVEDHSASRGPHTGHAFGCAWNRRSRGASYSRRHAGHIANGAIVVAGRSYGTPVAIVNRGPQSVQFVNA